MGDFIQIKSVFLLFCVGMYLTDGYDVNTTFYLLFLYPRHCGHVALFKSWGAIVQYLAGGYNVNGVCYIIGFAMGLVYLSVWCSQACIAFASGAVVSQARRSSMTSTTALWLQSDAESSTTSTTALWLQNAMHCACLFRIVPVRWPGLDVYSFCFWRRDANSGTQVQHDVDDCALASNVAESSMSSTSALWLQTRCFARACSESRQLDGLGFS